MWVPEMGLFVEVTAGTCLCLEECGRGKRGQGPGPISQRAEEGEGLAQEGVGAARGLRVSLRPSAGGEVSITWGLFFCAWSPPHLFTPPMGMDVKCYSFCFGFWATPPDVQTLHSSALRN